MEKENLSGKLIIEDRKSLTLNGVLNVAGFDEDYVSLDTSLGRVVIEGEGMKIESLEREGGVVHIVGIISSVFYTEQKNKSGVLRRIFK